MKPLLAILAHESAQPTIDDFLPKWKALNADLVCYLPDGHSVTGFDTVRHIGESAHAGMKVYRRFTDTLRDIIQTFPNQAFYIVAEYDTVPLRPVLPKFAPGLFMSHNLKLHPHMTEKGPMQVCSLSPWIMDADMMRTLLAACEKHLELGRRDHLHGLLDRWIGEIIDMNEIPHTMAIDTIGYPWHDGILKRIRQTGISWIHGFKSAADFGDLWNTQAS